MGKKDGKRVDKVKVEAKKAKQAAKQTKLVKKSVKKEIKELGEDDIEMMIAEVSAEESDLFFLNVMFIPCCLFVMVTLSCCTLQSLFLL